ncbi:c-type cytochrome [Opitutales bacterium]|nr:c-type cytochrome [Opitutales bacterium]
MRFLLLLIPILASADPFPELPNTESTTDADPPSAEESAKAFSLPEGVKVKVWAGEPMVQNPIAMAWDKRGRMWVAENYTYGSRKIRFDLSLRDRVIVLSDTDGDGQADTRKVFTDKVQMLTSVEVGHGGVWLMCPPKLLFIPDRNGDLVPDGEPEVMLDGFDVARGNYHNFANGLRWGPDGWLYGRCGHSCPGKIGVPGTPEELRYPIDGGIWRYHPKRKVVEVLAHGTVNPWGHDWDEHGELFFINTVIGHMWHMIPGAHYRESGSGASQNPLIYERMPQHADHFHYDTNLAWHKSRYGAADDFGGGHAHVGMAIYQADHFPVEWRNRLLTWNQHGRRLNRERLKREGSGYIGKHETDVFENSSEWFRGMEVSVGPDGAIYGLDWSDTGECHDHTGVHRTSGRIYKFFYEKNPVADLSLMENGFDETEAILRHPNVWYFRQFIKNLSESNLTEREKYSIIRICELNFVGRHPTFIRLRAMWVLHALHKTISQSWLNHPNEHIRAWVIRLKMDDQPIDTLFGPREKAMPTINPELMQKLVQQAITDESGLIRLTMASSLQRVPVESRGELAKALAFRSEDENDHNLPHLVWAGITPLVALDPQKLLEVARSTEWSNLRTWIARAITERSKENPVAFAALLKLVGDHPKQADSLLAGIERAVLGMKGFEKPVKWDLVRSKLGMNPTVLKLSVIFGDLQATQEMEKVVADGNMNSIIRRQTLEILIDSETPNLQSLCEKLLKDPEMKIMAVRGLAKYESVGIGKKITNRLDEFSKDEQKEVVGILCGRISWAGFLLEAIKGGKISKSVITPYHATQIQALKSDVLNSKLDEVWGTVRTSSKELEVRKEELRLELTSLHSGKADLQNGNILYEQQCASCHMLYGKGGKLGPDLTGSGRTNLDYLLENIVDPNSAVSVDYRMNILHLKDGRVLSGMIVGQDRNSLTLRMPSSEIVVSKSIIKTRETLSHSIMPVGLLDNLSREERRDLIAYLMNPVQVGK